MRVQLDSFKRHTALIKIACITISVLVLALASYFLLKNVHFAHADGIDWITADATSAIDTDRDTSEQISQNGSVMPIMESAYLGNAVIPTQLSVWHAKSFRIGQAGTTFYIGLNDDPHMYILDTLYNLGIISPNSDNIIYNSYEYVNVPSHLSWYENRTGKHFNIGDTSNSSAIHYFVDENDNNVNLGPHAISSNGEWMISGVKGQSRGGGFMRIHLTDLTFKYFTPDYGSYNVGMNPDYTGGLTISNDGRFAIISGLNIAPLIYDLD